MHNDVAATKEVSRPPSKLSLNRGSGKPPVSPQRPPSFSEHTTPPATKVLTSSSSSRAPSAPQFKLKSTPSSSSSTISFTRVASPSGALASATKASNWTEDMQTQEISSQGPLASQFDLGASQLLSTQARDPSSVVAQSSRIVEPPRKIDPLDEESDSSEESSDDDDDDSDSSSGSEGIEVISAEDSSEDEEDSRRAQQTERLKAQTALLAAPAMPAVAKPTTPEKAAAGGAVTSAAHSPNKDDTASGASTPAKDLAPTGPGMDLCCIDGCTKVHSNHVYNEAVGRMRELPNSQRMCRAHYIQGLGQCCVKDCTNKATNRNLKKGAKLPIKEGLHDQLHKVCMEHWNLVDQQTKGNEGKKKGKRKRKDAKTKGKKRRRNSGDAEVEAFLARELGSKASGESDSGYSDDESEAEADGRKNSNANEFYAVQKSAVEARGDKRDRVASTLSEEDASSDESYSESVKRRRTIKEENGRPTKVVATVKPIPTTPSRVGAQGVDRAEFVLGESKAKETKGAAVSEVQVLRSEVAQLRTELRDIKHFIKNALGEQLSALKSECLGLIDSKLREAHEREMVQLRLIHQASANRQQRPPGATPTKERSS
jgi:hypothetical protein